MGAAFTSPTHTPCPGVTDAGRVMVPEIVMSVLVLNGLPGPNNHSQPVIRKTKETTAATAMTFLKDIEPSFISHVIACIILPHYD